MSAIATMPEFVKAKDVVIEKEKRAIDLTVAQRIIAKMYELSGGKGFGNRFKEIRNDAIREVAVVSDEESPTFQGYKRFVSLFFSLRRNSRMEKVSKRPVYKSYAQTLPVEEGASASRVKIRVYEEVSLTFTARKPEGKLTKRDVISSAESISGPDFVGGSTFHRAREKAIAIMNDRRGFRPSRRRAQKTAGGRS